MKYIITLTFTFVLMITSLSAQQQIGIKGAYQLSNMAVDKDQIQEVNNKSGYHIGLINRTQKGAVIYQTELLWSHKGASYSLSDNTGVNANLSYIELPLSIGINLFNTPLSVYGGGYAAYLLSADYKYIDNSDIEFAAFDNKDAFSTFDFGMQLGAQFKVGDLLFDARYSRGLKNVEKDDIQVNTETFIANDTKNFNFQLGVAILF